MTKCEALKVVGRACAKWRKQQGVTQAQVADWAGCTSQNVSEFERGKNGSAIVLAWYAWSGMPGYLLREEMNKHG